MGFYYSSTNDQSPMAGNPATATGTTADPVANVDGVIPPNSVMPAQDLAPGFTPPPASTASPAAPDHILTDAPTTDASSAASEPPKPAEPAVSPAFNPNIGAPVAPSSSTPATEPAKAEPQAPATPAMDPLLAAPELDELDDTITPAYPEIDAAQEAAMPHDEPKPSAVSVPIADPGPSISEPETATEPAVSPVEETPAEPVPVTDQPAASTPDEPEPAAEEAPTLESIKEQALSQLPSTSSDTPTDLAAIKQQALQQLSPLFNHLNQDPEEKFNTTMMMLQATDDQSLVSKAYEVALSIPDEKARAQALMDIVNEINYFSKNEN